MYGYLSDMKARDYWLITRSVNRTAEERHPYDVDERVLVRRVTRLAFGVVNPSPLVSDSHILFSWRISHEKRLA